MKGSVNKGFLTYLLLFLGMILGVVLVCCAIMIFSPGTEILGYVYYSNKTETVIRNYNGIDPISSGDTILQNGEGEVVNAVETPIYNNFNTLNHLIIKTNNMKVNFVHGPEDRVDIETTYSGFNKKSDLTDFVIIKQYDVTTNTLTITAYNPSLLFTMNNSCEITVVIKNQTSSFNASVETTSGAVTYATNEFSTQYTKNLTLNSLAVSTQSGDVSIGNLGKVLASLNVAVDKANVTVSGSLGATETEKLSDINFEVTEGNLLIDSLYADNMEITGETTFIQGNSIYADVQSSIVRGNIELANIYGNFVGSDEMKNTRIVIGSVNGGFTLPANEGGSVTLDEVTGIVYIKSQSGSVQIKHTLNSVTVETTKGEIKILMEGDFNTSLKTQSGKITAIYADVLKSNTIETETGLVKVYYPEAISFKLEATSTKTINLIAENLTFNDQTVIGYPTQSDAVTETTNVLSITSEANIDIDIAQTISWSLIA